MKTTTQEFPPEMSKIQEVLRGRKKKFKIQESIEILEIKEQSMIQEADEVSRIEETKVSRA